MQHRPSVTSLPAMAAPQPTLPAFERPLHHPREPDAADPEQLASARGFSPSLIRRFNSDMTFGDRHLCLQARVVGKYVQIWNEPGHVGQTGYGHFPASCTFEIVGAFVPAHDLAGRCPLESWRLQGELVNFEARSYFPGDVPQGKRPPRRLVNHIGPSIEEQHRTGIYESVLLPEYTMVTRTGNKYNTDTFAPAGKLFRVNGETFGYMFGCRLNSLESLQTDFTLSGSYVQDEQGEEAGGHNWMIQDSDEDDDFERGCDDDGREGDVGGEVREEEDGEDEEGEEEDEFGDENLGNGGGGSDSDSSLVSIVISPS